MIEPIIADVRSLAKADPKRSQATRVDRWARHLVLKLLHKIQVGKLILEEQGRVLQFGGDASELAAHISVHHITAYRDILLRGSIGSGEAYMQGAWSSPDLTKVIRLIVANQHLMDDMDGRLSTPRKLITALSRAGLRLFHALRMNSKRQARQNIAAHYDLGNRFFELFLDPTMMYSAAIFPTATSSLEDASLYKIERICRRLQLHADDHLLEIGTGWGGLALYAAQHFGCRVTTTTISREQYEYAKQRIDAAGFKRSRRVIAVRLPRVGGAIRQVGVGGDDRGGRS